MALFPPNKTNRPTYPPAKAPSQNHRPTLWLVGGFGPPTNQPTDQPTNRPTPYRSNSEVPKADSVRCLTVCRVLVLPRSSYTAIAANFPMSARQVRHRVTPRVTG